MAGICSRCDGVNRVHSTSLGCNDKWYVPSIIIMQLLKGREKGRCQHLSWLPLVCVPIIIENKWMICFWHVAAVVAPTSFLRLTSSSLSFAAWQQHAPHESVKRKAIFWHWQAASATTTDPFSCSSSCSICANCVVLSCFLSAALSLPFVRWFPSALPLPRSFRQLI